MLKLFKELSESKNRHKKQMEAQTNHQTNSNEPNTAPVEQQKQKTSATVRRIASLGPR